MPATSTVAAMPPGSGVARKSCSAPRTKTKRSPRMLSMVTGRANTPPMLVSRDDGAAGSRAPASSSAGSCMTRTTTALVATSLTLPPRPRCGAVPKTLATPSATARGNAAMCISTAPQQKSVSAPCSTGDQRARKPRKSASPKFENASASAGFHPARASAASYGLLPSSTPSADAPSNGTPRRTVAIARAATDTTSAIVTVTPATCGRLPSSGASVTRLSQSQ